MVHSPVITVLWVVVRSGIDAGLQKAGPMSCINGKRWSIDHSVVQERAVDADSGIVRSIPQAKLLGMAEHTVWGWFGDPPMRVGWRTFRALMLLAVFGVLVVTARHYLKLPEIEFGAEGAALNGLILAFLIGFRNKASYDRWWEARMQWGKLVNDSRNLC